jgi:DNA-binding HxlR family transcriptional regulator
MDGMTDGTVTLAGGLADRDAWTAIDRCSIGKALTVVGTRSAMLIMREAAYGTRRFDQFARRVGITEAVAAARLKELVEAGLFTREPYQQPGERTRHEYVLTDMGRDLMPALFALMQWGDRYLQGKRGPGVELVHVGCDAPVAVETRCAAGHQVALAETALRVRQRSDTSAT